MSKPERILLVLVLALAPLGLLSMRTLAAPLTLGSTPPVPTANIPWSGGYGSVADVQAAFNHAHQVEGAQLGISIPLLEFPTQADWDALNDNQKAFWLMNHERVYRGVDPWTDSEANVTAVAQGYANYLMSTNQWGHSADGHDPWWRMDQRPAIQTCHDFLPMGENLA